MKDKNMNKNILKIGLALMAIIFAGQTIFAQAKKSTKSVTEYKVTFMELGSVRCIPCQKMTAVLESIKKKYPKQVKVEFYDVWTAEGKPMSTKYGIRSIPTQIFLDKNGNEYFRHVGYFPEEELVKILKKGDVQ